MATMTKSSATAPTIVAVTALLFVIVICSPIWCERAACFYAFKTKEKHVICAWPVLISSGFRHIHFHLVKRKDKKRWELKVLVSHHSLSLFQNVFFFLFGKVRKMHTLATNLLLLQVATGCSHKWSSGDCERMFTQVSERLLIRVVACIMLTDIQTPHDWLVGWCDGNCSTKNENSHRWPAGKQLHAPSCSLLQICPKHFVFRKI